MTTKAAMVGIPLDLGAENLGVDIGPSAFRHEGIIEKLGNVGLEIRDKGDVLCKQRTQLEIGNPKLKYLSEILRVSNESAKIAHELIGEDRKVIVLGGDHSVNLGAVSGASVAVNGDLGLIYFDAHGDMNTDETTQTGNIHGMHLASLLGFGTKELVNVYQESTKIQKQNLLHIGGYDLDSEEIALIEREELLCYRMFDILSTGLAPLFKHIDALQSQVKHIWVSLDLDAIDSTYAPGAGMPNKAGLTYREISIIAQYIGQRCNVLGVDVVEYNPLQDIEGKTAELSMELIAKFLGHNYSWYTNYLEANTRKTS